MMLLKRSALTFGRSFASKLKPLAIRDAPLKERDPELFELINKEEHRQWSGIELIASENFTSRAVLECLGSCLTNKYSEGYPGARYYGGNEFIDQVETLAQKRALEAFGLDSKAWGVNVQPYSGSPANFAVYTALVKPGGRVMGLDLPSGGHLTHGYQTEKKKISATSYYFQSRPYRVSPQTGIIDYDECEKIAKEFKPEMLICGFSAYPRDLDYKRFRKIADSVGAYLMADIAHISGLVATGEANNPFEYCDVVTSTTHKSLRGPRAGIIFYSKAGKRGDLSEKINFAVFPMLQGGPHEHQIAGICTQMKEVKSPEFKEYIRRVKGNAKALANGLIKRGHKLMTNGTDNHLMLLDFRPLDLTGSKMEKLYEKIHISVNKNSIAGDKSAQIPGGVRIGTPAMTTRGCDVNDMDEIAELLHRGSEIALKIQKKTGKKLNAFLDQMETSEDVKKLGQDVQSFAKRFSIPGIDATKFL